MSTQQVLEKPWKRRKPGVNRAKRVLRAKSFSKTLSDKTTRVYVMAYKVGASDFGRSYPWVNIPTIGLSSMDLDKPDAETVMYNDKVEGLSRIISAERVESGVEVSEFLDIMNDEALAYVKLPGNGHYVLGKNEVKEIKKIISEAKVSGTAQTIRGAYVNYHNNLGK